MRVNREKRAPESWARHKRYTAIENVLAEGEVLLTAHHQDDQLERRSCCACCAGQVCWAWRRCAPCAGSGAGCMRARC